MTSLVRIKDEIDEVENEEGFYIMDVEFKEKITCKIMYNDFLYTFDYPQNYPNCEPNIKITDLKTQNIIPFVFGDDEWTPYWSTRTLIISLDANING